MIFKKLGFEIKFNWLRKTSLAGEEAQALGTFLAYHAANRAFELVNSYQVPKQILPAIITDELNVILSALGNSSRCTVWRCFDESGKWDMNWSMNNA